MRQSSVYISYIARVFIAHASVETTAIHCTAVNDGLIFHLVELVFQAFNTLGVEGTSCKTKVSQLNMPSAVDKEVLGRHDAESILAIGYENEMKALDLWFEITMDVAKRVEFSDTSEHFGDIEASVFLFQNARVVEKRAEIAARDIFHCKVNVLLVLECVEKLNKPRSLRSRENISFHEYMSDL